MRKPISLFLFILLLFSAQSLFSQRTVRMNLERIIGNAAIIFHGTVTHVESVVDSETNIPATFVTFAVKENFYGCSQNSITIKMLGGKSQKRNVKLSEMPRYSIGEEVISAFYAPSPIGFSSPVGMGQGTFSVVTDSQKKTAFVKSSFNNSQLFANLQHKSALAKAAWISSPNEEISLDDFSQTIRSLVTILKK
ncbi:MAG: hypothetical protein H3C35_09730 [Bacteroidetes bacterium]|nr:hypothetical protein [Bacteroidota bacterium]